LIDRNLAGWPRMCCWPSRSSRWRARSGGTRLTARPSGAEARRPRRRRRADPGRDRANGHDLGFRLSPMTSGPGGRWHCCAPTRPGRGRASRTGGAVGRGARPAARRVPRRRGGIRVRVRRDEAWVVSLAIDFCAGYTDGDPLRLEPGGRRVVHERLGPAQGSRGLPKLLACLPGALDAWVRFRRPSARDSPEWAANETRGSIGDWHRRWSRPPSTRLWADRPKQFCSRRRRRALTSRMSSRWAHSSRAGTRAAS